MLIIKIGFQFSEIVKGKMRRFKCPDPESVNLFRNIPLLPPSNPQECPLFNWRRWYFPMRSLKLYDWETLWGCLRKMGLRRWVFHALHSAGLSIQPTGLWRRRWWRERPSPLREEILLPTMRLLSLSLLMADVGATDEDDMEVNNMPGGRGRGQGGGPGRSRGRGHGGGSGSGYGNLLEPFVGIGESIIQGVSGKKRNHDEDLMSIQPVGEPIRVDEFGFNPPILVNPGFPETDKDLSVRAEVNILKDQVGRIGDLLKKINNRLDGLEKTLTTGEKEKRAIEGKEAE